VQVQPTTFVEQRERGDLISFMRTLKTRTSYDSFLRNTSLLRNYEEHVAQQL